MLKNFTKYNLLLAFALLVSGSFITSCEEDEENPGSQIILNSFGPSPALRGGDIKFIGTNLDKVTSIVLPGEVEVSDFITHTSGLIELTVPEETVEGLVTLKTPNGDIVTKTILGISEPIALTAISPLEVRPGDLLTLTGTYLNLIETVVFNSNQEVTEFESQSQTSLTLIVPEAAQTGNISIVAALEEDAPADAEPIVVQSEEELIVTLPTVSGMSPGTVKAGSSLTISGTNLDLVKEINFPGADNVTEFELTEDGDIVVTVPANAQDGNFALITASRVEVESSTGLVMMLPAITAVNPNPVKPGNEITVTGTNLDLVTSVMFGGEKEGTIAEGRTETFLTVVVPEDATEGVVTFNTAANKSVASGDALELINPAISTVSPIEVKRNANITITGTHLDLVDSVVFAGGVGGTIVDGGTPEELVVTVPTGAQSGTITLMAKNGTQIESTESLTVVASNVPTVASIMPNPAKAGTLITIEGEKLHLATEVIFPGDVKATSFGEKTATKLEVIVPEGTATGVGTITFVTAEGEMTESIPLTVEGEIPYYIYDDALSAEWQKWNGWGTTEQDLASTEEVKAGTNAIKISYNDDYGAFQLHPIDPNVLDGYTHIVLSVYGASGNNRMALQVKTPGGSFSAEPTFNLVEGEYTTFEIPISSLGTLEGGVAEFMIKNYGANPNTIYIDEFGLR